MTIIPCAPAEQTALLSFILPYEKLAVGFVSHILQGDSDFFLVIEDGRIYDAFSLSKGGQIFHCLPDAYSEKQGRLLTVLTDFFSPHKNIELFNIIGEEKGSELLQRAIHSATGRTTQHDQHYILLEETPPSNNPSAEKTIVPQNSNSFSEPLTLVCCTPTMIDALLPLQIAYEKEEIQWKDSPIDPKLTRLTLLHALRTQQIFSLAKNGVLIAKGGTNAIGKKYAQLGGIYTIPSERGKGYAEKIIRHLTENLAAQRKKIVLFVKPENVPALRLYEKCGFKQIGRFEIAYY